MIQDGSSEIEAAAPLDPQALQRIIFYHPHNQKIKHTARQDDPHLLLSIGHPSPELAGERSVYLTGSLELNKAHGKS